MPNAPEIPDGGSRTVRRRRFPKVFFGWWTVLVGTFVNFWYSAFIVYGFSALFKPIAADLSLSRAVTSIAGSATRVEGNLLGPVVGWLSDRYGPKWLIMAGMAAFSLGLISMYYVNSVWTFYLAWGGLIGLGGSISGVPVDMAITNWFVKKRGIALGIRWILSGVLVLPLIAWLITAHGWRVTCLLGGIIGGIVGLPLAWFCLKQHRPEYYGLLPDGASEGKPAGTEQTIHRGIRYAAGVEEIEFTLRQAMRTPAFWTIIMGQASYMGAHQATAMHLIPFLTDKGLNLTSAATTMTFAGMIGIGARLVGGLIGDRLKKGHLRLLFGAAILLMGVAVVSLLLEQSTATIYLSLALYYVGFGISMVTATMIWGRYYGRKAFGSIRGISVMSPIPLIIMLPIYAGLMFDMHGDYVIAFGTMAAVFVVGGLLLLIARPPEPPAEVTDISKIV